MNELTFDQLPKVVSEMADRLEKIEKLLLSQVNPTQPEADQFLTIKQVAEILTLSVPTIYGLVQRAEIPSCKKGKRLYFSRIELMDWIKAGRKKTNSEIEAETLKHSKRRGR